MEAEASGIVERSSTHCNMVEGELVVDLGLFEAEGVFDRDMYVDLPPVLPPSSEPTETAMTELSPERAPLPKLSPEDAHKCPPSHPHLPSSHPQPSICAVGSQQVCQSPSVLRLEDPLSPPPASESRTPPRPVDRAAPPWLLAPSSPPWPGSPLAPPDSFIPPAPPWSVIDHPVPQDSIQLASPCSSGSVRLLHPFGSSLVLCHSSSTVASRIHASASVTGATCSTSALRILLISLAHQLSVSTSGSSATCSTAIIAPLELSALPSPWLLPPSAPLGVVIMAVSWVPPVPPVSIWSALVALVISPVHSVSSFAPPSVVSTQASFRCPPPGYPSSFRASSQVSTHATLFP
ncbi:hypothetical protein M9458_028962, partial [Cirrhinus mrigala]